MAVGVALVVDRVVAVDVAGEVVPSVAWTTPPGFVSEDLVEALFTRWFCALKRGEAAELVADLRAQYDWAQECWDAGRCAAAVGKVAVGKAA